MSFAALAKTCAGLALLSFTACSSQRSSLLLTAVGDSGWDPSNATAEPEIILQFNAEVVPEKATPSLEFRSAGGLRVTAEVCQATQSDDCYWRYQAMDSNSRFIWKQHFHAPIVRPTPQRADYYPIFPANHAAISNRLVIWPSKALPIAHGWKLIISKSLPSVERNLRLSAACEVFIGDVTPFTLATVSVKNSLQSGKRINLDFSKQISTCLDTNNWTNWVSISPRPEGLSAAIQSHGFRICGDFELNKPYRLGVRTGFPAEEPFTLGRDTNQLLEFAPLEPRLYFPAFSAGQIDAGSRRLELLALNLHQVHIQAKQLDRHTLIHALRGYQSYYKSRLGKYEYLEPYREMDWNLVPGRTIFDKIIETSAPTDTARKIPLEWNDMLGENMPGAVFLMAEEPPAESRASERPGTESLIQLTDIGLLWKCSRREATVYAFSHTTGKPISDATIRLMSEENEPIIEKQTDGQGLAQIPLEQEAAKGNRSHSKADRDLQPRWLMAEAGPDLHAVPLDRNLPLYGFNIPVDWSSDEPERPRVLFFSDRPVYRPGETVHLKSIARVWKQSHLAIPGSMKGALRCFDPKGEKFYQTNAVFTALGAWSCSVPLPQGVLGQYRAELELDGIEHGHWFQVQEFQPNAFEISIKNKPAYAAGEPIQIPISARYYMGKNLSRANVRWSLEGSDSCFAPPGFEDFTFGTTISQPELRRTQSSFAGQGEGVLSNKSDFVIAPATSFNPKAPQPRSVNVFVEITDLNQQTLSQSAAFASHSSDFYLGLKKFKEVVRQGEPLTVELIAARADGSPHPQPVQGQLTIQRISWRTVRIQGAGRARAYQSDPVLTNILEQEITTQPVQRVGDKWEIQSSAVPSAVFIPQQPGLYLLEVRTADAGARPVIAATTFNVCGKDELAWNYRNEAQLELVPDQTNYLTGDTATILLKAPFSGTALVTVEREKVLRSFVAEVEGNAPAIRVPLETNDVPNVFVSVMLVRGAKDSPKKFKNPEYRLGYCQLNVTSPETKLDIVVKTDAADYQPGDSIHLGVEVKDSAGQPVPETEVSLYAVDEGILSLTEYPTPDPHAFFFATRPLSVRCGLSLPNLMPEDPEQLDFHNKGYLIGGGSAKQRPRKNFLPCAFWNATLCTGSNGQVEASFLAPDSLTSYRVIAIGHSVQSQFGSSHSFFQVSKPLMIEPALPGFANVTDRIVARAVVHNQTDQEGEVEVTLQLDDKAISAEPVPNLLAPIPGKENRSTCLSRSLHVAAHGSVPAEFYLQFIETGTARWVWKARFAVQPGLQVQTQNSELIPMPRHAPLATFTDSVQSTLNVGHVLPLLREIHLARTEAAATNLLAGVHPRLLEGEGVLTVSVSNTRLGGLGEAISQLLHYPYGCVEQTSSSLLPWLVLRPVAGGIPQLNQSATQIEAAINAGIKRLFSMQTQTGGLAYWPGSNEPMLWGSAYGGMVLAVAARQHAAISQSNFEKLLNYLSQQLRNSSELQSGPSLSERCLALLALAMSGRSEAAYHELLFKKRAMLSAESRAFLAIAILESRGPPTMAEELLQTRALERPQEDNWFGCGARGLAVSLLAWTRLRAADPKIDVLVEELMKEQKEAHWGTTQGNAWALYALAEYATRVEARLKTASGSIVFGERSVPFQFGEQAATFESAFSLSSGRLSAPLEVRNPGRRLLFTKTKIEARPRAIQQAGVDRGYLVQRAYTKLDDDNTASDLAKLRVGDSVLISLKIEVRAQAHFLAIDDPLPSVLEAVNPEFRSRETRNASATSVRSVPLVDWFSDFRELRKDRALFFRNHLGPGSYRIRYVARVRAAGTATVPPTKVEEMYHPERFGLSDTIEITSLPSE